MLQNRLSTHRQINKRYFIRYAPVLRYERRQRGQTELAKKTIDAFLVRMTLHFALSLTLSAQQQPDPKPLRFDVTAFLGYRTSMSFPVEPQSQK